MTKTYIAAPTVRACVSCGEPFADSDFDAGYPAAESCRPCRHGEQPVKDNLDECYCGDYRRDHDEDGRRLNGLGHPGGPCRQFLLTGRKGWRERSGVTFV